MNTQPKAVKKMTLNKETIRSLTRQPRESDQAVTNPTWDCPTVWCSGSHCTKYC